MQFGVSLLTLNNLSKVCDRFAEIVCKGGNFKEIIKNESNLGIQDRWLDHYD